MIEARKDMSRRDIVKYLAGIGTGVLATNAFERFLNKQEKAIPPITELEDILSNPELYIDKMVKTSGYAVESNIVDVTEPGENKTSLLGFFYLFPSEDAYRQYDPQSEKLQYLGLMTREEIPLNPSIPRVALNNNTVTVRGRIKVDNLTMQMMRAPLFMPVQQTLVDADLYSSPKS